MKRDLESEKLGRTSALLFISVLLAFFFHVPFTSFWVAVIFLAAAVFSVESLIGLRPPPHKDKDKEDKRESDNSNRKDHKTLKFRQPSGFTPLSLLTIVYLDECCMGKQQVAWKENVRSTGLQENDGTCYFPELFKCSRILLERSVLNDSQPCTRINSFSQCTATALSRESRRNYMKGLSVLRKLTAPFHQRHGCPKINITQPHLRHFQSKDAHSDDCCVSSLLTCSVRSFLDSMQNPRPGKCILVSGYKQCLYSSSSSCHWNNFLDRLPTMISFGLNCASNT